MKTAVLGGNALHVCDEDRDDRGTGRLCDVTNARLTDPDVHSIPPRTLGIDDQMKIADGLPKSLQLADSIDVKFAPLEQETDFAAEHSFDRGRLPHILVTQYQDRVA